MDAIYKNINERVIAYIEKNNVLPWQKDANACNAGVNLLTGRSYKGINHLLLSLNEDTSPYYVTAKQANKMKGSVKDGARPTRLYRFEKVRLDKNTTGSSERCFTVVKPFDVFNIEDVDGVSKLQDTPLRCRTLTFSRGMIENQCGKDPLIGALSPVMQKLTIGLTQGFIGIQSDKLPCSSQAGWMKIINTASSERADALVKASALAQKACHTILKPPGRAPVSKVRNK